MLGKLVFLNQRFGNWKILYLKDRLGDKTSSKFGI